LFLAGRLGEALYAEAEYVHDCRSIMRDAEGGLTWRASLPPIHYCTHSLGPLLHVTGQRVVSAIGLRTATAVDPALPAPAMEVALFRTEAGLPIKVLCGFAVERRPAFHTFQLYGTRGCLEKPRHAEHTWAYFADQDAPAMVELPIGFRHAGAPAHASRGGHGTCEHAMLSAWVEALTTGGPLPIDLWRGLEMTLPGLCAHLSAEQGGAPVPVPDWR